MKKRSPSKNQPCPCGSGKLYKRCCENKPKTVKKKISKKSSDTVWSKYNSADLLKTIAGLSVSSTNHSKYVRLELISLEILKDCNTKTDTISSASLKKELDSNYASHPAEDPTFNLFTDLITYFGGDYILLPGITEGGTFMLSNLLAGINHWPDSNIPQDYIDSSEHAIRLFLNISNTIAQRLNLSRYEIGTDKSTDIDVPNQVALTLLKNAVTFTKNEMDELLINNSIDPRALAEFLIEPDSIKDINIETSPLQLKPFYHDSEANKYIIVAPYNLAHALKQYLWFSAVKMDCLAEVNNAYHQLTWNQIQSGLSRMGFEYIQDFQFPETELPIHTGLYKFDDDKVAFINLIFDKGEGFNPFEIFSPTKESMVNSKELNIYCKSVQEQILADPEYENYEAIDLTLFAPIGRNFYHSVDKTLLGKQLTIPVYELDVLFNLKNVKAIDIWKFAIAYDEQLPKGSFIYSTLDAFALFRDKDNSFYINDENKFGWITTEIGYARSLLKESKLKTDKHSALQNSASGLSHVQVESYDSHWPIYLNATNLAHSELSVLIAGYNQPIWIKPGFDINSIDPAIRPMLWQINEALAYWVWQLQDDFLPILEPLGDKPLSVEFTLSDIEAFINIERDFTRDPEIENRFDTMATANTISIEIPSALIPYLYGADNEADRMLAKQVMLGMNLLLTNNGLDQLSEEQQNAILENRAPQGFKKKFYLLDSNDNLLLDERNLVDVRYVQQYDTSKVLDSIVPLLGEHCPPIGTIASKTDKETLLHNIIQKALFPELKRVISQYDSTELLKRLIPLNESLINSRAKSRILTPTRIACFVSAEEQINDLNKNLKDVNTTSLAVRCLIEHIVAESSSGTKEVSICAIDELVAIMHQIINFGSLGDQVRHDLFNIEMSVLPTDRIGTEKEIGNAIFDPYNHSKTKEHVTDAIESFSQAFPQNEEIPTKDIPETLDKAFETDYGISLTLLIGIIDCMVAIGFVQNNFYAAMSMSKLKEEIKKRLEIKDEVLEAGLEYLSLVNRGKVETLPNGYKYFDIEPWRFSRRLSLLRKPLCIVNIAEKEDFVYWGPRHLFQSRSYLADQCVTNRLRVEDDSAVCSALGKIAGQLGDSLVNKIIKSISSKNLIIDKEQFIGPSYSLRNADDIGDIDILIIDKKRKVLFSLECKNFSPSRNIKEMIEEVHKLYEDSGKMGLIEKHLRRHNWIEDNRDKISAKYDVDISDYKIVSLFVTNEDMFTPYLKKDDLEIPFVTSYNIEENGYEELLKYV